ncbi:hypothetical protein PsorP6_000063 [Peronosclerospora sorghi]|uniref:Uncharacterized protein n=1 Tax=Peronosclerospora sorghi TaxID=230839 RepID=A0ACC0WNZ0_9STRA|nr:hypothetical protein PsorP6_000063 [Peronosclerospora sorghi]
MTQGTWASKAGTCPTVTPEDFFWISARQVVECTISIAVEMFHFLPIVVATVTLHWRAVRFKIAIKLFTRRWQRCYLKVLDLLYANTSFPCFGVVVNPQVPLQHGHDYCPVQMLPQQKCQKAALPAASIHRHLRDLVCTRG